MLVRKPKSLKILGQRVKIIYTDRISEDDDLLGLFTAHPYTIHIVDNDLWEQTLLHELTHAVLRISGLAELIDPSVDEAITQAIESGLFEHYKLRK